MKCVLLLMAATAAVAMADSRPEPFFRRGVYKVDDAPVAKFKDWNFDLKGILSNAYDFKTGLVAQAWAIAQPAFFFFLAAFVVYVFASMVFQLAFAVFNGKMGVFTGFWTWLSTWLGGINTAVLSKFANLKNFDDEAEVDAAGGDVANEARSRRNAAFPTESQLLSLLSGVAEAISKYD